MGHALSTFWDQSFFIADPTFKEKDLPDQTGKVHIITGGYTGVGFALAQILYPKNATIYIAGRSQSKGSTAISSLQKQFPDSKGSLHFLKLDLADLPTIKSSAQEFLSKENRLDVLTNNAGVMIPPPNSKTVQGHDLQTGTNVYGPWLFTQFLVPLLKETARKSETGSVRVTWAASFAIEGFAPKGGVVFDNGGLLANLKNGTKQYGQSKAANVLLGVEGARRWGSDGIISNSFNPGNLASELQRHAGIVNRLFIKSLVHPVYKGAWTELYAGWSPDITPDLNGAYVIPWGRIGTYNEALRNAVKRKEDGGEGKAEKLWEACEKACREYL